MPTPRMNAGHYYNTGHGHTYDAYKRDYGQKLVVEPLESSGVGIENWSFCGVAYSDFFDASGFHPQDAFGDFSLTTLYPGLLVGTGYRHPVLRKVSNDSNNGESDFQLGLYFDWTTGLPIIPGSTVKGLLRSVFMNSPHVAELMGTDDPTVGELIPALEKRLFSRKPPDGQRLVFYDAYIVRIPADGLLFAEDYITPHRDGPTKDPVPLRFLKIAPGVTFRFQFGNLVDLDIDGWSVTRNSIKAAFKRILKDFGVGAKRNVGYGAWTDA